MLRSWSVPLSDWQVVSRGLFRTLPRLRGRPAREFSTLAPPPPTLSTPTIPPRRETHPSCEPAAVSDSCVFIARRETKRRFLARVMSLPTIAARQGVTLTTPIQPMDRR